MNCKPGTMDFTNVVEAIYEYILDYGYYWSDCGALLFMDPNYGFAIEQEVRSNKGTIPQKESNHD